MFERLTDLTRRFAYHRFASLWLFFYSVIESVFFPISPEVLMIPMSLARPQRAIAFATIGAIGSVAGGIIGYGIGYWAFDSIAQPILNWTCLHMADTCPDVFLPRIESLFAEHGLWVVAIAAMSPIIPYRFVILGAGLGHMAFWPFVLVSLLVHWIRYTAICWAVGHYGSAALDFARRRLPHIFAAIGAIALVVFLAVAYF